MGKTYTIYDMAEADPEELADFLLERYTRSIPEQLSSKDDLGRASELLAKLANEKTFLFSLLSLLKLRARIEKGKGKENRECAEKMAMRRDTADLVLESVKSQYDAVSRMITVYKMQMDEMRMAGQL